MRLARCLQGAVDTKPERTPGKLPVQACLFAGYLLLQSLMNLYMKWLLSRVRVAHDLVGVPASFLITAAQQLVGLLLFALLVALSRMAGRPYTPKALASRKEYFVLLALSVSFSLNIGLQLLSLSLVPLSLAMIVRACSPLSTALVQILVAREKQDISAGEWACMLAGVLCAGAMVVAQGGPTGTVDRAFLFGVAALVASLFSGALDFAFKDVLGTDVKLNALDTTSYTALPVALITSVLGSAVAKPVSPTWGARFAPSMTDLDIFRSLWRADPSVLAWVALSGVLAFLYNVFVTFLVVELSPATVAFAANVNKAAVILLSLALLEGALVPGLRGAVLAAAAVGNIASFTAYNFLKRRRQARR